MPSAATDRGGNINRRLFSVPFNRGAWNRLRGREPQDAMKAYILTVTDLCPTWLGEVQPPSQGDSGTMSQEEMNKDLQWEGSDKEEDENGAGVGFGVTVSTMAAGQG